MKSEIITNLEKETFCGFDKTQIYDGVISIALITLAAMQLCGSLPGIIDQHIFTYGAIGLGFLKASGGVFELKKNKKALSTLILGLAIIALGITARFDKLNLTDLSISMLAVGTFSAALLFVHKKIVNDHYIRYRVGNKAIVDKTDREKYFNIFFKLVSLGALALGAMKLCGLLPDWLNDTTLTTIALGVGGATTVFACYKKLIDTEKRHDITEELLAGCALLTIGALAVAHVLQSYDVAKAIVGIEGAMLGIGLLYYMASKDKKLQKNLQNVELEGYNAR